VAPRPVLVVCLVCLVGSAGEEGVGVRGISWAGDVMRRSDACYLRVRLGGVCV